METKNLNAVLFSKDQINQMNDLIDRLGLRKYYPGQLKLSDVNNITLDDNAQFDRLGFEFVRNLLMTNCECRDKLIHEYMKRIREVSKDKTNESQSKSGILDNIFENEGGNETIDDLVNPLDLTLIVFKCSSPMLIPVLAKKLFVCRLAIPFVYPKLDNKDLKILFWPLRSLLIENSVHELSLNMSVDCPSLIVSCIRLGRPSVSKSKLINDILNHQYHDTFFNKDCSLGKSNRTISDGLIESAWYIPSGKLKLMNNLTMFLNLRGDALHFNEQFQLMSKLSKVVIVFVNINLLDDDRFQENISSLYNCKRGVLLAIDAFDNDKDTVKEKLSLYLKQMNQPEELTRFALLSVNKTTSCASTIKDNIIKGISKLADNASLFSLESTVLQFKIPLDEDDVDHEKVKYKAKEILHLFREECQKSKDDVLPLQGVLWRSYSQGLKSVNKSSEYKSLQEINKIRSTMQTDRMKQMETCANLKPFMKMYLDALLQYSKKENYLILFVMWMKLLLDDLSRKEEECPYSAKASIGLEYFCREMGQVYEALKGFDDIPEHMKEITNTLPEVAAKLLIMGQPFEIMDGDAANVPFIWVKAVLSHLQGILGDIKLLTISVLGIQSSGKSTLLNTMFGLQCAVGVGRCTRGAFMQLVPVTSVKLPYNYVLVVDTEGLRAPERTRLRHSYDNQLATFVIGLGDITVINIKGENTAELRDVLQISIHAFLRLKLANSSLNLKQSCVFIHQNVPGTYINDKTMKQDRKNLVEVLDEMTRAAALQLNIVEIESFNQVIEFDSNQHVWYFPDIWRGDPPMAPANTGYSEHTAVVKETLLFSLTAKRKTYLTIMDIFNRVEDIWNGIMKDDFVYSFRNCLELKAFNCIEQHCQAMRWALEKYVLEYIISDVQSSLKGCHGDQELEKTVDEKIEELNDKIRNQVESHKNDLDKFVRSHTLQDIMIQWLQYQHNKLTALTATLILNAKIRINSTKEEIRITMLQSIDNKKNEAIINDSARNLAVKMSGATPNDNIHILEIEFDNMWSSMISKFPIADISDSSSIHDLIKSMMCEEFPRDAGFMEKSLYDDHYYQNLKQLKGSLETNSILNDDHLSIHGMIPVLKPKVEVCKAQAVNVIDGLFGKIDTELSKHSTKDVKFDIYYVKPIITLVVNFIENFNNHKDNEYKFNMLLPFQGMVINHIVRYVTVFFTKLNDNYNSKHSPKAHIEKYKETAWSLFKSIVECKTEEVIAVGFLRKAIVTIILEYIPQVLLIDVEEMMLFSFAGGKYSLIKYILIRLAEDNNFEEIKSYIQNPKAFAEKFLLDVANEKLFSDTSYYASLAELRITNIFAILSKSVEDAKVHTDKNGDISKWIQYFIQYNKRHKGLQIDYDDLTHVRNIKLTDVSGFSDMVVESLQDMKNHVVGEFQKATKESVIWKGNPIAKILVKLWGCDESCIFCNEPCMNTNTDHLEAGRSHMCLQHRPQGINGFRSIETQKLVIEFCNHSVRSKSTYSLRKKELSGKYKLYKKIFPDWYIPANSDTSKYWIWIMNKYQDELAAMYGSKTPDIPMWWKSITKKEALESLNPFT